MAAAPAYGVDAAAVRDDCFASMESFSVTTTPSAASVARVITEQAGFLQGRLLREGINASGIQAATGAYAMCAYVLKLMVAVAIARNMTGMNSDVVKAWNEAIAAWFKSLDADGSTFLGDDSLQTSTTPPDGPTTHINYFGLSTSAGVKPSSIDPIFTRDDKL